MTHVCHLQSILAILRLHLVSVLKGAKDGFTLWQGMLCSSWVSMCRSTTRRSWLNPLGLESLQCVALGNTMVSRTVYLKWSSSLIPLILCASPPTSQDGLDLASLRGSGGQLGLGATSEFSSMETPKISMDVYHAQGLEYKLGR